MSEDHIDYGGLVEQALRGVVRTILRHAADQGVPGGRAFYIGFDTTDPGVEMPEWLRTQHPETIRIVLEHQFWNLEVGEEAFSVDLRFGGVLASLTVPFEAMTLFADPSEPFGLQFGQDEADEETSAEAPTVHSQGVATEATTADVVSLDAFRKR